MRAWKLPSTAAILTALLLLAVGCSTRGGRGEPVTLIDGRHFTTVRPGETWTCPTNIPGVKLGYGVTDVGLKLHWGIDVTPPAK